MAMTKLALMGAISVASLYTTFEVANAESIVLRSQWGAERPIAKRVPPIKTGKFGKTIVRAENIAPLRKNAKYITIHHVKRRASTMLVSKTMRSFQKQMFKYHIDLSGGRRLQIYLSDIPYHFFIHSSGTVAEGRSLKYAAYSNTQYDTPIEQHITVVLDGDFDANEPSSTQLNSLTNLLTKLSKRYNVPASNISWHKKVANSECPGKLLIPHLPKIIRTVAKRNGQ